MNGGDSKTRWITSWKGRKHDEFFVAGTTESCSVGTEYKRLPSGKEVVADRGPTVCTSSGVEPWLMTVIVVALGIAAIVTAVYLGRKMRRPAAT